MKKIYIVIVSILLLVFICSSIYKIEKNNGNCIVVLFNETATDSINVIFKLDERIDSIVLRNQHWNNYYELAPYNLPLGKNEMQMYIPKFETGISKSLFIWNCHFVYIDIYEINDSINYSIKNRLKRRGFE